jgi:hypothetical protein
VLVVLEVVQREAIAEVEPGEGAPPLDEGNFPPRVLPFSLCPAARGADARRLAVRAEQLAHDGKALVGVGERDRLYRDRTDHARRQSSIRAAWSGSIGYCSATWIGGP